jgi:hypothetical protein
VQSSTKGGLKMKRRIYKLQTNFTLLGLDATDWGILFATFVITLNFFKNTLGQRAALLISLISTALVYIVWHLVKDKVPENFMKHLLGWLGEPEIYKVMPDTKNVPLVVDFSEVRAADKKAKKIEQPWRLPVGRPDSWL